MGSKSFLISSSSASVIFSRPDSLANPFIQHFLPWANTTPWSLNSIVGYELTKFLRLPKGLTHSTSSSMIPSFALSSCS